MGSNWKTTVVRGKQDSSAEGKRSKCDRLQLNSPLTIFLNNLHLVLTFTSDVAPFCNAEQGHIFGTCSVSKSMGSIQSPGCP